MVCGQLRGLLLSVPISAALLIRLNVTSGLLVLCGSYSLVSYRLSFCIRVYSLDGESPKYVKAKLSPT